MRMKEKIHDKWIRVALMCILLVNLIILNGIGGDRRSFNAEMIYFFLYFLSIFLILECGRYFILLFQEKYPGKKNTRKRLVMTLSVVMVSNFGLIFVTNYVSHLIRRIFHPNVSFFLVILFLFLGLVLAIIQLSVYEGLYYYALLRKSEKEKDSLEKANYQSQLDALKQQVNPHFLFNCINTVSSLVDIDPPRANKFLAEMSRVYRYLLQANNEELVTVEKELEFISSYFHLLKTRFNEGLCLNVEVAEQDKKCLIPPITLQLLIENAIKHNIVEKENPLSIDIIARGNGFMEIRNNLQKKNFSMESTRIGLANIMAKYALLNQPEVVVRETEDAFLVCLPLIEKNQYENSDSRG